MTPFDLIASELTVDDWDRVEYALAADAARRRTLGLPAIAVLDKLHAVVRQALALNELASMSVDGHDAGQIGDLDEIVTVHWVAVRVGRTDRQVRRYAQAGRLPGARRINRTWAIPAKAALTALTPGRNAA